MLLLGDFSVRSDYKIALAAYWELFSVRIPLSYPMVLVVPVVLVPAFARRELQIKDGFSCTLSVTETGSRDVEVLILSLSFLFVSPPSFEVGHQDTFE